MSGDDSTRSYTSTMLRTLAALLFLTTPALAQTPAPAQAPVNQPATHWPTKDGNFDIPDFHFKSGETLLKLHLHFLTLGTPHRDAAGHAHSLLNPVFSDVLFGPGQPFDITRYFLILPDDIGQGDSSKPSDGLHMRFPQYDYDDMVRSQQIMLTEGLHVDHLRLILGTSMGCMQGFVWGETYPQFMDALAPFACLPTTLAGRNRMMRYMAIENIKNDPAWHNGDYTMEPKLGLRTANEMLLIMGSAPLQMQKLYPTREAAENYVDTTLDRTVAHTDANNLIYYVNASRNYNPEPRLSTITAPVLYINSADDFINPN